jgi:catechol-2,3-dioxygenase
MTNTKTHLPAEAIQLSHMGIFVNDISVMSEYYQEVLDFRVTDKGQLAEVELVFLSRNPLEHHQIVMATGRPATIDFCVVNQISFRVPSLEYLRLFQMRANSHPNTKDCVSVCHGNALSIYLRDPENNRVEIFIDTPWYCEQPVREPIDLNLPDEEVMQIALSSAKSRPGFCSREDWLKKMNQLMGL